MIHMEEKKTTVLIPRNRYDQVCRTESKKIENNEFAIVGNESFK